MAEANQHTRRPLMSLHDDTLVSTASTGFQRFLQQERVEVYRQAEVIEYQSYTEIIETVKSIQLSSVNSADTFYQDSIFGSSSASIESEQTSVHSEQSVSTRSKKHFDRSSSRNKSDNRLCNVYKSKKRTNRSDVGVTDVTKDTSNKENSGRLNAKFAIDVAGAFKVSVDPTPAAIDTSSGASTLIERRSTPTTSFALKPWSPPPLENYIRDVDDTVSSRNTYSIKKKKRCKKNVKRKSLEKNAQQLNLTRATDVIHWTSANMEKAASSPNMYYTMNKTPDKAATGRRPSSFTYGQRNHDVTLRDYSMPCDATLHEDETYCEPTIDDDATTADDAAMPCAGDAGMEQNEYDTVMSYTPADNTYASLIGVANTPPPVTRRPPTPPPPRAGSHSDLSTHDVTLTDTTLRHSDSSRMSQSMQYISGTATRSVSSATPVPSPRLQTPSNRHRSPDVMSQFKVAVPAHGSRKTCTKKLRTMMRRLNLRTRRKNVDSLKRVLRVPEAHINVKSRALSDRFHKYSVNDIAESYYNLVSGLHSDEHAATSTNSIAASTARSVASDVTDTSYVAGAHFSPAEPWRAGVDVRPKAIVKPRTVPVSMTSAFEPFRASAAAANKPGNTTTSPAVSEFYC